MHEIFVYGHVCIDVNRTEHASFTAAGSPPMFMEKIFRQLPDCRLTIAAPYGKDFEPYSRGISLSPAVPQGETTMRYENTVTGGTRVQKCLYWDVKPVPVDETLITMIRTADTICLAPLAPNITPESVGKITRYKKKASTTVLLPQGYFRQFDADGTVRVREFVEAPKILPHIDVVVVSDEDHPGMLSMARTWSLSFGTTVIVTQAEQGAAVIQNGNIKEVPTTPVPLRDVVSSVGAGDAFAAGFMYQLFRTHDVVTAAAFANAIARQCLFCKPDDIRIRRVYQTQ